MAKINYSAAEVDEILGASSALAESVPPRITHTWQSTAINDLDGVKAFLQSIVDGMPYYGVRFAAFRTGTAFAPFAGNAPVYHVCITIAGSHVNGVAIIVKTSGTSNSTYPRIMYMTLASGTWSAPVSIQA